MTAEKTGAAPRRRALLMTLAAVAACVASGTDAGGAGPSTSWSEMSSVFRGLFTAARDEDGRWILAPPGPAPEGHPPGGPLEAAAREALSAGADHLAWVASGILARHMGDAAPAGAEPLPAQVPPDAAGALLAQPAFAEPLRRLAWAALGARGIPCSDCLEGIRPSRDVTWRELREYLTGFIHVRSVDDEGRIDLRVGTLSSSLPPPEECDLDLAAAAHALMRLSAVNDPAVRKLIGAALNAELVDLQGFPPEVLRRKLNESVPFRVLTDPLAMRPIIARTPEALDLHGLRCTDCAERLPGR